MSDPLTYDCDFVSKNPQSAINRINSQYAIYNNERKKLRDEFAMAALSMAWDAYDKGYWTCDPEDINRTVAQGAYQMADAMLKAREVE